jgi:hypothetical protein
VGGMLQRCKYRLAGMDTPKGEPHERCECETKLTGVQRGIRQEGNQTLKVEPAAGVEACCKKKDL